MGKFSLNTILNAQSKAAEQTGGTMEIRQIPIEKLRSSESNQYGIRDIEELAASIEAMGLMHNLLVKEADSDGMYEIISGDRRYHACYLLLMGGNQKFATLPCKVEPLGENKNLAELKLLYANASTRVLTDWEKTWQASRIRELLTSLKADGYEFQGRMRDHVAEILQVSSAQVGRLEKISRDLSPEFTEELKQEKIGITTAYDLSKQTKEEQSKSWGTYLDKGPEELKQELKKKRAKAEPTQSGPELEENLDSLMNQAIKKLDREEEQHQSVPTSLTSTPSKETGLIDFDRVKSTEDLKARTEQAHEERPLPGQETFFNDAPADSCSFDDAQSIIEALQDLADVADTCGTVPSDQVADTCREAAKILESLWSLLQ